MATIITIPTLPVPYGHCPLRVDLTLSSSQARKLNSIRKGLIADDAKLDGSDSVIRDAKDALQFLIETAAIP